LKRNQRLTKIQYLLDEESPLRMPQVGAIIRTTLTNRHCARIPLALWRLVFRNLLHHNKVGNNNARSSNATVIFRILRNATTERGSLLVSERLAHVACTICDSDKTAQGIERVYYNESVNAGSGDVAVLLTKKAAV
jgi:hypothetical protein